MSKERGQEVLLNVLFNNLQYAKYSADKRHIRARCPYCGDSKSSKHEVNFNIRIPDDEIPRWLYICFRASCLEKGYIDQNFLQMIGGEEYDASVYLNKVNRKSGKGNKRFKGKNRRSISNFPSPTDRLSKAKLKYLNSRLGLDLSMKDLVKLKIHTDFAYLYKMNDIQIPPDKAKYYENLSIRGLAFISAYNDYIVLRNVDKNSKARRYTNIDIFENDLDEDKYKFYLIPTKIDVMSTEQIVINLAEGAFDILSVYHNLDIDSDYENHIYASVSGSSYKKVLMHLIRQYGLVDIVVNIFSDDNVKIGEYNTLYAGVRRYVNTMDMKVYYNKIGKDFGVKKSEIELQENTISTIF